MTLRLPDDTKCARIVLQITGPLARLHLRHVPSNWVITWTGIGPNIDVQVDEFRRVAERHGYMVEPGYSVEDWTARIKGMMKS